MTNAPETQSSPDTRQRGDAGVRRRSWLAVVMLIVGCVLAGLGALWTLQGAGAVHLRPILCVSNCTPVTGFTTSWLVTGLVSLAGGGTLIVLGLRRAHPG